MFLSDLIRVKLVLLFGLSIFSLAGEGIKAIDANASQEYKSGKGKALEVLLRPNPKSQLLDVGLSAYLGLKPGSSEIGTGLKLKSAGEYLILKDSNGVIHRAKEINLGWRKLPIDPNTSVNYQVVGPFASFESADRIASILKNYSIEVRIAHPLDWEIWVDQGIQLPKGISSKSNHQKLNFEIRPTLKLETGEVSLSGPLQIEALDGLIWKGGNYLGPFSLKPDAYGTWTLIEHVPLERYLQGVVPYEIGSNSPSAALSAQAVLARTWALANKHRFLVDGYHLCSDVQCQVYKNPLKASLKIKKAIKKTSGKVLTWQGAPISAVYHASNGGVMAGVEEAWSMSPLPYFKVKLDGQKAWKDDFILPLQNSSDIRRLLSSTDGSYGNTHRLFRWNRIYSSKELKQELKKSLDINLLGLPLEIKVRERGASGRVISLEILSGENKSIALLQLDKIRKTLRKLPSTLFVVNELQEGIWEFQGGGYGHGAGMSQSGAIDLAGKGWNEYEILMHYYPGTKYGTLRY